MTDDVEHRPLYIIAAEIQRDWHKMYFGAKPYVDAMMEIDRISERNGSDTAVSVVLYFLSNSASWRGEKARLIKAELKNIVNTHKKQKIA